MKNQYDEYDGNMEFEVHNLNCEDNAELTCNRRRRGLENAKRLTHSDGKATAPTKEGLSGRMTCSRRRRAKAFD